MLYLPDTNVFSQHLRGRHPGLSKRLLELRPWIRISSIVKSELLYGAARRPERPEFRSRVLMLAALFAPAPYEPSDAEYYAAIRVHLETLRPNAQPIGANDLLLAAQAVRLGAVFVTHNTREFARVPALVLEDWQSA